MGATIQRRGPTQTPSLAPRVGRWYGLVPHMQLCLLQEHGKLNDPKNQSNIEAVKINEVKSVQTYEGSRDQNIY